MSAPLAEAPAKPQPTVNGLPASQGVGAQRRHLMPARRSVWLLCRTLLEFLWGCLMFLSQKHPWEEWELFGCWRIEQPPALSEIPVAQLALYRAAGVEPYTVSAVAGRGLRCSRRGGLAAGTTLWDEPPYAALLAVRLWKSHCQHCFSELTSSQVVATREDWRECLRCHQVAYCSEACQAADPHHRDECDWLRRSRSNDAELTQARILGARIARRWKPSKELPRDDGFGCLYTNHSRLSAVVRRDIVAQLAAVRELAPAAELDASSLLNLFGRQFANACSMPMPMWTHGAVHRDDICSISQSSGSGIWLLMSLCNHSCEPNCWPHVNKGGRLSLRTLRPISFGEAITISYVIQPMPYFARRQHLQSVYHFSCNCGRCQREEAVFLTPNGQTVSCAGVEHAWELVQAGEAERDAAELGNAEALFREALVSCSEAQDKINGAVAEVRARALDGLARIALGNHRWHLAIRMLERSFEAGCVTAQAGGRCVSSTHAHGSQGSTDHLEGVQAMEIARLHARCGDSDEARKWAEFGRLSLERTHGRGVAALICARGRGSDRRAFWTAAHSNAGSVI